MQVVNILGVTNENHRNDKDSVMKVCPSCGKVIGFNSYFGAYICDDCRWEDDAFYLERIKYYSDRSVKKI